MFCGFTLLRQKGRALFAPVPKAAETVPTVKSLMHSAALAAWATAAGAENLPPFRCVIATLRLHPTEALLRLRDALLLFLPALLQALRDGRQVSLIQFRGLRRTGRLSLPRSAGVVNRSPLISKLLGSRSWRC